MHRLLLLLVLVIAVFAAIVNFSPLKAELAYKFNLANDPTTSCCDPEEIASSTGDFDEGASTAIFNDQVIDYPKTSLSYDFSNPKAEQQSNVLGTTNENGEEKWIEVDLAKQLVTAWEGSNLVMQFPISSGKWAPTPEGTFNIWYKTRAQVMKGGSKELNTYYYLPNVPSNMFFYKGYALHGAYWHNNFGHPMSHGCVNEPLANAKEIFDWAGPVVPEGKNWVKASPENPGTRVFVHS
jgi:lipoprotein-anchoring transpeptidase ErfK/SrfK